MTKSNISILERESIDMYFCDGKNVSRNCLRFNKLRICQGCGLALCENCFTEHKEEVAND